MRGIPEKSTPLWHKPPSDAVGQTGQVDEEQRARREDVKQILGCARNDTLRPFLNTLSGLGVGSRRIIGFHQFVAVVLHFLFGALHAKFGETFQQVR